MSRFNIPLQFESWDDLLQELSDDLFLEHRVLTSRAAAHICAGKRGSLLGM